MDCPKWILSGLWLVSLASASTLIELLGRIRQESDFEYVLLMRNKNMSVSDEVWNGSTLAKDIMDTLQVPVLQLDENVSYFFHSFTNNRLISMVFMSNVNLDEHRSLLQALVGNLRHMTTSRVIFLVQMDAKSGGLYELFKDCWRKKILNVMVLFADHEVGKSKSNF